MENNNFDNNNIIAGMDSGELSVDAILAEYKAAETFSEPLPQAEENFSRPIVFSSGDPGVGEAKISSAMDFINSQSEPEPPYQDEDFLPDDDFSQLSGALSEKPSTPAETDFTKYFNDTPAPEEDVLQQAVEAAAEDSLSADEFIWQQQAEDTQPNEQYAEADEYSADFDVDSSQRERAPRQADLRERLLSPIYALASASALKRQQRREQQQARAQQAPSQPELAPLRASAFYADQARAIRLRCLFATALCLPLIYLSYGLPAMGALGSSLVIRSLVCLVLELTVMLIGLDIITNGLVSLFSKKPGAETLIAVSCLVSCIDALVIALTGNSAVGLPFSAVSSLSVCFSLWGSYLTCASFSVNMAVAGSSKSPSVVLSQSGADQDGCVLAKSRRPVTGFVRQAEKADVFESAYRLFTPILLSASLILSLLCFVVGKGCDNFLHTLSACTAACASFSAVFGFAFPFSVLTKRLSRSGAALAGYSGAAELGRIRRVMITDTDVFPVRTIAIADIAISDGASPDRVISYTGSMIAAAAMGLSPVFTELMRKNGCSLQTVEDFACHEGGGVLARINGESVYVGSSSFMRLMGVRLPKNASSKTAVFTAINDILCGVFIINYTPVSSVQRALVALLRGRNEPLFAVRDFSITPLLIKQKFRLPSGSYDFPSFSDRYRISSPEAEEQGTVCAMFSRGGLNAVAGLVTRSRKLYNGLRISAVLSVLGSLVGLVLMLSLLWSGSYDSAGVSNLMTFMLLWLAPVFVFSLGLRR